ncbi:MAG: DegQ family serine endoprotease [Planctomycetaceae bacterium]|nr:DegQ family serine endoprotease [Planctomycetaceae bacterium]
MKVWQREFRVYGTVGTVVLACFVGALLRPHRDASSAGSAAEDQVAPLQEQPQQETALDLSDSFRAVAKALRPSVVSITSVKTIDRSNSQQRFQQFDHPQLPEQLREYFGDEGLDRFFQFSNPQGTYQQQGLGSGVVISEDGYLLSNNHVVRNADEVTVILSDERQFKAELVGSDAATDLAVLKIDATGLTPAKLGDSSSLSVGDWVLAIGSPMGLEQTVTAGIISATGRANVGIADYEDFLQTDAAINPGNSGGPLLNLRGEVIGINTAISSRGGGNDGIGFAIPVNMAKWVANQLIENGEVKRGFLGVMIQDLNGPLAKKLNVNVDDGALVAQVLSDSPASKAGLKPGDVVMKLDGHKVNSPKSLQNAVEKLDIGKAYDLTILRGGEEQTLSVTIEKMPTDDLQARSTQSGSQNRFDELGLDVQELTSRLRSQLNIKGNVEGVVVSKVEAGTPADNAGLKAGDVIEKVGNEKVTTPDEFEAAIKNSKLEDGILLLVHANGGSKFLVLQ